MVDKVKPLKMETLGDGSEFDVIPTETDPTEDYVSAKGISFENSDIYKIDLDEADNITAPSFSGLFAMRNKVTAIKPFIVPTFHQSITFDCFTVEQDAELRVEQDAEFIIFN